MWFIGVEVEQETSAAPPEKILDPPLLSVFQGGSRVISLPCSLFFDVQKTAARGTN